MAGRLPHQEHDELFSRMEQGASSPRPSATFANSQLQHEEQQPGAVREEQNVEDSIAPAPQDDALSLPPNGPVMLAGRRAPRPRPLQLPNSLPRGRSNPVNIASQETTEELQDDSILPYLAGRPAVETDRQLPLSPWSPQPPKTPWSPHPPRTPYSPNMPLTPLPGYGGRRTSNFSSTDVLGSSTPYTGFTGKDDCKASAELKMSPERAARIGKYRAMMGEKADDKFTMYRKVRQNSESSESPYEAGEIGEERSKWPKAPRIGCSGGALFGQVRSTLSHINPFLSSSQRSRHLDGLRLLAAILVLSSTVVGSVPSDSTLARTLLYPIRSDFGLVLFFVLSGRVVALPWLRPRAANAVKDKSAPATAAAADSQQPLPPSAAGPFAAADSAEEVEKAGATASSSSLPPPPPSHFSSEPIFMTLGRSILSRPFRFLLPSLIVSAIQYRLCKSTAMSASYTDFHAVFSKPFATSWCFRDATDWVTAFVNLFTMETMSEVLRRQTSMLFTVPWLLQGTYYAYAMAMFGEMLGTDTRLFFYFAMAAFNWASWAFLVPFTAGVFLADLDVSGRVARLVRPASINGKRRSAFLVALTGSTLLGLFVQLVLVGIVGVALFVPAARDNVTEALTALHTLVAPFTYEWWSGYEMIRFADVVAAVSLVALVDVTPVLRLGFACSPLAFAGQHLSAGMTVLHPLVFWNIVPRLLSIPTDAVSSADTSTTVAKAWIICLGITAALAVVFRVLLEYPSSMLGELFTAALMKRGKYFFNPASANRTAASPEESGAPEHTAC